MLCDLSYLKKLSGGDNNFISEMVRLFLKQTPIDLVKLQQAIADEDVDTVKRTVHKLKSSVSMLGVGKMTVQLKNMESLLATGSDCMVFWEPYNTLEKDFTEVKKELEPMLP